MCHSAFSLTAFQSTHIPGKMVPLIRTVFLKTLRKCWGHKEQAPGTPVQWMMISGQPSGRQQVCSADMMGMTAPTAEVAVPVEGHLGGSMEPTGEVFFDRRHCTQQRLDTKENSNEPCRHILKVPRNTGDRGH